MTNKIRIKVKKIHPEAVIPQYAHPGDAGMDLYSVEDTIIKAGERAIVGTGLSIELPEGYVSLIWDKSGVAAKNGIKTMAGVLEHTYRGEYKIVMFNTSKDNFEIKKGQKIAQVLIQPIMTAEVEEVKDLSDTARGAGGFGSTGVK
jgi:dUTP pyrophosphatase